MILDEIKDHKKALRLYIHSLGGLCAFFIVAVQLAGAHYLMAAISSVAGLYFSIVFFHLWRRDSYLWEGRGIILILPPTLLHALYANPEYGVLWTYVCVVTLFLLLPLREGVLVNALYVAATAFFLVPYYDADMLSRIYASLAVVALFTFGFSYLIDKLLARLDTMATSDPLTKTLNRHTFHTSMEMALGENKRYGVTSTLLIFDLDHFKQINDKHGHLVGDKILTELASIVHARLRDTDQFFRYGGEEFAVLLRHTALQNASHLAEALRETVDEHSFTKGLSVTISCGLAEVRNEDDVNDWVERADSALYEAKSAGRNCTKINVPMLKGWDEFLAQDPALDTIKVAQA